MTAVSAIRGQVGHWLLDLDVGGRLYHFSDETLEIEDADGDVTLYAEGLDRVKVEYVLEGGSPQSAGINIGEEAGVDWGLLVAQGVDLGGTTGTLRRWFEGELLDEARVVIAGTISEPEYGSIDEGLSISLERFPWDDSTSLIGSSARATTATWPLEDGFYEDRQIDPDVEGATYPLVFGCPGLGSEPATPAYLVDVGSGAHTYSDSKLLIAGHHVHATSVKVFDLSDEGVVIRFVINGYDKLGQEVAYVQGFDDMSELSALRAIEGHEYWISWFADRGGMYNRERSGPLRQAGQLLRHLLETTNLPVAVGVVAAESSVLDAYLLDGAVTEDESVTDWIDGNLLPILPLVYSETAEGIAYRALRFEATASDAVAHLVALDADDDGGAGGFEVERAGTIKASERGEVKNRFVLDYGRSDSIHTKRLVLTGEPEEGEHGSYLCRISQGRYDVRTETIETNVVWDDATAARILRSLALRYALPRRHVTYVGGSELEALSVGDVVLVSDAEVYLDEALAIIDGIEIADDEVGLNLVLLDGMRETG